jgi:hypothetical protein
MKRILLLIVLSASVLFASAQRSIDRLFEKYAGNDGFVTLTLSGNLLNLLKSHENGCKEDHWPEGITEIRMLVQDDDNMRIENFYDIARRDLDSRDYEEFMNVKKSGKDFKMLARIDGKTIKELLIIGGGEDNFIIQLKGNITIEEAEDLASEVQKEKGRSMLSTID